MTLPLQYRHLLLLLLVLAAVFWIYWPGLNGTWLLDDEMNLGELKAAAPGSLSADEYMTIILGNQSGPLGRPVAMASFAVNHALGLFSTPMLKLGNILLHLGNGVLLYFLMLRLAKLRHPLPGHASPRWLALLITTWWLLLPIHISSILYIIQRMTLLATFFSLASCLCYITGRQQIQMAHKRGWLLIGFGLLLFFPLAVFTKENAVITLAWLLLIELFFFYESSPPRFYFSTRAWLRILVALVILAGLAMVQLDVFSSHYLWREFSLPDRLLSQPRALAAYIHTIFLPDAASMGIYQDDFPISRALFSPPSTALTLGLLVGLLVLAIQSAGTRWWGISFGVMFYLTGHLVESTVVPLELYFEHRNYLPSAGLLLAVLTAVTLAWPFRRSMLVIFVAVYLAILALSANQRIQAWSKRSLLIETSALNHPYSLRAWTDYPEELLHQRKPRLALEAALRSAETNPAYASISYVQMISIYCRLHTPAPALLVKKTADALIHTTILASSVTTPLAIGLERVLADHIAGHCTSTDFRPLVRALPDLDARLARHYGPQREALWFLRLTLAEWLLELNETGKALFILQDIWQTGDRASKPMPGLTLARALVDAGRLDQARQVLAELAAVTHDAPADFQAKMNALQQRASGKL